MDVIRLGWFPLADSVSASPAYQDPLRLVTDTDSSFLSSPPQQSRHIENVSPPLWKIKAPLKNWLISDCSCVTVPLHHNTNHCSIAQHSQEIFRRWTMLLILYSSRFMGRKDIVIKKQPATFPKRGGGWVAMPPKKECLFLSWGLPWVHKSTSLNVLSRKTKIMKVRLVFVKLLLWCQVCFTSWLNFSLLPANTCYSLRR